MSFVRDGANAIAVERESESGLERDRERAIDWRMGEGTGEFGRIRNLFLRTAADQREEEDNWGFI